MAENNTLTITDNRTNKTYTFRLRTARSAPWICGRSRPVPTISG